VSLWQRNGFSALPVTHDVEEALFLANRVIIFSDYPPRIRAEIKVDLPYPRHRGDAASCTPRPDRAKKKTAYRREKCVVRNCRGDCYTFRRLSYRPESTSCFHPA
jgi:ABC-type nitrate/sulfonate/bicarbonate transport system ATPase subunit